MALLLVHLNKSEEEMPTLTKKELSVLDDIAPGHTVHLIETEHEGTRWWRMAVTHPHQNKVYEVITALGKTKLWKRLDIAVDFIKENCPSTKVFYVVFDSTNN